MTRAEEEVLIAKLAARQHGIVTRAQLLNAGVHASVLDRRVASNRLRPLQRGVYQVGPVAVPRGAEMAAILACGAGAFASHRSAGLLWNLGSRPDAHGLVHVTVAGADRGRRPGIRVHRVSKLDPSEVTTLDGIPITVPARTLVDLASVAHVRELEQAVARAERQRLTTRFELLSLLPAYRTRRGMRRLLRVLENACGPLLSRSEAEELLLALIRRARLPEPETNVRVGGYEVDFLWRVARLVVEVDGYAFHSSRITFEQDRLRDAELSSLGYRVVRVTWRQITREPEALLVRLARLLNVPGEGLVAPV